MTTRRDRRRAATYEEIVAAAREQLSEGRELALRAIADRIGMSSPGLYRYIASRSQLIDLVAEAIDADAVRAVEADVARYPERDPAARWIAGWAGYRQWALRHEGEFRLLVAHPRSSEEPALRVRTASDSYVGVLLHGVWQHQAFAVPEVACTPRSVPGADSPADRRTTEWPPGLEWLHTRVCASLNGILTLEVTGYVEDHLVTSGALFRESVVDWLPRLGLADQAGRLSGVLDAELAV